MEKNEKKLFIVLEQHLYERYHYMINKYDFDSYLVGGFGDIQIGNSIKHIFNRIKFRKIITTEYAKLQCFINQKSKEYKLEQIYFSNSEGYIAYNILLKIRADFPNLELIGLQHGVFELSEAPKSKVRYLVNNICKLFYGFYPIGAGFGSKIVDKYIVYNDVYKAFLIDKFNWSETNVSSDINFLKCELFDKRELRKKNKKVAVFLMQCLNKAGMCSEIDEQFLNKTVLEYLSKRYDTVLVKTHPADTKELNFPINTNVKQIDDLIGAFNCSTHAYSFSSTTLLEANIFDVKPYAINSKIVKEDKSIYSVFENVLSFEDEIIC
jgi:hypothetical protein|tara:strand:+ start:5790 stop:6758 length:969 start_codon:yes stop_codon:yes gene_type:complete